MNLSGLLSLIESRRAYETFRRLLGEAQSVESSSGSAAAQPVARVSVLDPAKPFLLAALERDLDRPMLVIGASEARARDLSQQLAAWVGDADRVTLLPAPEPLFYERLPSHPSTTQGRLRALQTLTLGSSPIVVTSVRALMRNVIPPDQFRALSRIVRTGERIRPDDLVAALVGLGYLGEALVEYPGSFSRRGGILDVFPVDATWPVRLEFFGDEIDTLREFDPATQRSTRTVNELRLTPSREVPLASDEAVQAIRSVDVSGLSESGLAQWSRDLDRLAERATFDGIEFYAPYLTEATVVDYLAPTTLVVIDEPASVASAAEELARQSEELRGELIERGDLPRLFRVGYREWLELNEALSRFAQLRLTWQDDAESHQLPTHDVSVGRFADARAVPSYAGQLRAALDDVERWRRGRMTTALVTQQSGRVAELLADAGVPAAVVNDVRSAPEAGSLLLVHGSLGEGFELTSNATDGGLVVLTDRELFGWTKPARQPPARRPSREAFLSELTAGDYVVHVDHGVGRFARMIRMNTEAGEREYLVLEYAAGDKLYVPADQTDRVSRYIGVGEQTPTLHRLGTTEWARTRIKVKQAVQELAGDLLRLYAVRQVKTGHAFAPDSVWQRELEDSFPYVETPDQLKAIEDVKADMEQPRPMDRLLCGDVGYGKTEVALRAAFKAVNDGKQVAVLVPTTVLAQQHFNTFRERLQAFPIRIEVLSRFRSEKEQKHVIDSLRSGQVDICIGTHRLVQKDVVFHNLGLLIIDEEQRFGVVQKEHFKKLRTEIDVLTLSATPIPRTLHLALVGARDLSVMETPPEDRLPIRTSVSSYDDGLIREVILRELDRGGQVFFVHNRVQSIYQLANHLGELVPHASIVVGHGQMPEEQLEKVMLDFAAGRYDVLVCSTIIESGLDIPNVNTIVVNRADLFGLAQLYQLRGRVGRGANRAYAYFLTPKDRQLGEIAEKRLRTIFEASDLGAGYRIALKDLEIRGAGNLLGAEQSGHVAAVGFHLYTQMLAEAVKTLKGEEVAPPPNVVVDLPLDAYLPAKYVEDEQARLSLYARMAALSDDTKVGDLLRELRDRYGELPEPALNLIYLIQLKILAAKAGITKIAADGDQIVLQLAEGHRANADLLRRFGPLLAVGRTQVRLSRERAGANWLAILQDVVDAAGSGSTVAAASAQRQ
jgi:transcription-repair coupling factor (superfamily II helicase)